MKFFTPSLRGIGACAGILSLLTVSAQHPDDRYTSGPDVMTDTLSYFLRMSDVPDSYFILPPHAMPGTPEFQRDSLRYEWGKTMRMTARGDTAVTDARVGGDGVPRAFSEAFGIEITPQTTPQIYKLIVRLREDAGDLATRKAKRKYDRERPFIHFDEATCNPEQQAELSHNGSYPSGHTSIGWATALVLAEINTDRQDLILRRGYEMGESRVICGYHYQSDVDAGRVTGSMIVARLHADAGFCRQLELAKEEFRRLKEAGLIAR